MARSLEFDGNDYIQRRLKHVRPGKELPSLADRYDLDRRHLDVPDDELIDWIGKVVGLWGRQKAEGTPNVADACGQLIAADEQLRGQPGYDDAEWWRALIRDARPGVPDRPSRPRPAPPSTPRRAEPAGKPPSADQPASGATPGPAPTLSRAVEVEHREDRLVLRWRVSPGAAPSVRFTVHRLPGPGTDSRRWQTSGTSIEDLDPPAGRPLVYRVTPEDPESEVPMVGIQVRVTFAPPVSNLAAAQVSDGGVTGRWRTHASARGTQVRRTPAAPGASPAGGVLIPSEAGRFHDRGAPPGRHVYAVVPIYEEPGKPEGIRGRSRSVEVEVVDPPPPPRVAVEEGRQDGASEVVLRWDPMPAGAALLLRRAAAEPSAAAGDMLTLEDAYTAGAPVADGETLGGTTARVTLPAGRWLLVPWAVAGNLAVRGDSIPVVVIPPVENAEATRNGPNVVLSWNWPEGMRLARITWRTGNAELEREVTFGEYRQRGAVSFQSGEAAEARITGVVRSGASELLSAPVTVTVAAQTTKLTFHVHRVWPWQFRRVRPYRLHGPRWWCATRRIVIKSDLACASLRVEFVARTPSGGAESEIPVCLIEQLELAPDRPHELVQTLPDLSALDRRPWYLTCRAQTISGPVQVNDFASTGREIRPCFR